MFAVQAIDAMDEVLHYITSWTFNVA